MAWEQRRGRPYYYRKVRQGERVYSKYVGAGLLAQLAAKEDDDQRRHRAAQRAADHAAHQVEAQIDQQLTAVESVIAALTRAALFAAGYHQHKGQWRMKRHE